MAPPRKQALPAPLPEGFLLTDTEKKTWRLGNIIGQGGFGLIYLASQDLDNPVAQDSDFVIKVEYHENGPLFSELKFYQRAAKAESMRKWKRTKKLDFLGIPVYWGSGLAEHNGTRYRFMAMDRLGRDLQKLCDENGGRLKKDTVLQLGCILLDILEYVHDNEYVHADIKAANLMLGHRDPDKVYLADYGLSYRYCPDGVHKEYKENPKKGHNGTIEYTSVDAHNGVAPSRRGDLQVLGFCMLHWLCGKLPWDSVLKNPTQVHEAKSRLMGDLPGSVQLIEGGATTDEVAQFLLHVKMLEYKQRPDYQKLRELLSAGRSGACGGQGRLDLSGTHGELVGGSTTRGPTRAKKGGQTRGSFKHKPVAMEVEESEETEIEFEEKGQSKPVPTRYIRGPPISRPQPEKKPSRAKAPARVSKPHPVPASREDEEEERPRPIAACYIRGPPIGPRPQPEQGKSRTKTPKPDLNRTSSRPKINDRKSRYQRGRVPPINRDRLVEQQDNYSEICGRMQMDSSQTRSGRWNEPSYEDDPWEHNDHKCDDQWWGDHQRYYSHPDDDIRENPTNRYRDGNWEEHVKNDNNQKERSGPKQKGIWSAKLYGCIFVLLFLILVVLFAL